MPERSKSRADQVVSDLLQSWEVVKALAQDRKCWWSYAPTGAMRLDDDTANVSSS